MAYPPHGSAQKERIRFALCCVAVLLRRFLYQRAGGCLAVWNGKGERSVPISRRLFSPKSEDSPHQSCLQPFPNILVNAIIDIAALVVELPHGKTCYVAAEMLQDHFHSVRVAFARRQNNGIGNKGIFRVKIKATASNARENMSALRRLFFFCCRSVELGSVHKRHYFFSSEESKLPKLVTPHRIKPTISSYLNQSSILAFDGLSSQ